MFKNFELRHHSSTVEATVAQQLHQSERKKSAVYPCLPAGRFSFLIFWYFFIKKKVQKKIVT
jgi:hypothetical protein